MKIHTVNSGESIYSIASEYGVSPETVKWANGIESGHALSCGYRILIPMPTKTYSVRRADTLESICRRFGVSAASLLAKNPSLLGRTVVYEGQSLSIKYADAKYGMCAANGYFYRGCTRERLYRFMPYMSFVTVCSAHLNGGRLGFLFDDTEVRRIAAENAKITYLRVYMRECDLPRGVRCAEVASDIAIVAKSRGFSGVVLGGESPHSESVGDYGAFVLALRKKCIECDLSLLCECDAEGNTERADIADGAVLFYDKLAKKKIPSFDEGERAHLTRFAEKYDAPRSFLDLSAFGYRKDKYIPKEEILRSREHARRKVDFNPDTLIESTVSSNGIITLCESIDATKAKLTLVYELGFLGISFDIARAPVRELFLFENMFGTGAVAVSSTAKYQSSAGPI